MSEPTTNAPPARGAALALHPASTLVAWLEAQVRGRRVVVLGDATAGLAEGLAARGARLVHAYDPDVARAAEAAAASSRAIAPRPVFAPLEAESSVRDGAFDVVVVADLGVFGDPADTMRRVRRLLSPSGVAVIASRNPDASRWLVRAGNPPIGGALTYYDLFDLVSLQFPEVKMLGQTPFVGYAIVDFAADEPEVTVDASLLEETESPEWYVVVAGDRRVDVDPYALIELPFVDVASGLAGGEPTTLRRNEIAEAGLALEQRTRELEAEIAHLREGLSSAAGAVRDREGIAARLAEAERELTAAIARMREAEARAADTHVRAERLSTELRELDDELRRQRERGARLNKLLDEERRGRGRGGPVIHPDRVAGAGTIAMPPPTGFEAAAVTIRPDGGPQDDLRRVLAREATLRHELDRATARIVELERQQREDASPPATLEPVTVEPATLDRERVKTRLAESDLRIRQLEGRVAERDAKLAEREQRLAELDAQLAEREARAVAAERKVVVALGQREAIEARLAGQEPELASLRVERDRLATERQRTAAERDKLDGQRLAEITAHEGTRAALSRSEARVSELEAQLEAARSRADAAERRAASAVSGGALARAHEEEVDRLEAALRERGREVARLQGELREGLRIGKELLDELETAHVILPRSGGVGPDGAGADGAGPEGGGGSRAEVEAAAERAAKAHADLVGAALKIAQLESEVRRLRTTRTPDEARRELERALVLAQEEIAQLRSSSEPGPAIEQQVLLHQLDSTHNGAASPPPSGGPPSGR